MPAVDKKSKSSHIHFPEELPISSRVLDIAKAIDSHPVVIVAGETGSGKTTQLPKIALAMGRGLSAHIGVTQPRRIATTSVAARVAQELKVELGREVGYQIRFADRTGPNTYVKFMTDGILLAETQGDPKLLAYDTIIIDEAHERSLNIDFLLGYLQRLLPKRRDLRVIISSATLETERFAAFFHKAPIISIEGRTFPVEIIHRPPTPQENDLSQTIANVVDEISELDKREDILIFLPGEREIREALDELTSRALPHTVLLPLYGRLSQAEQQRVFQPLPQRRIVLATNVAETSLTIPGIVFVVDAGLARINRNNPRSGVTQLQIEPISRASADQRKGRAGRIQSGICFRLYAEDDYLNRPAYTDPEILRVGLAGVILQMKALSIGDIEDFPFLDAPSKRAIDEGYRVLTEIGALDEKGSLTDIGKALARLPVDPRLGRMILGGEQEGVLREVLIVAAALGIQDPRDRPISAQKQADAKHAQFKNEESDFAGLLKLWHAFQDAQEKLSQNQLRKWCRDQFLSYVRLREWTDIHRQLAQIARELGLNTNEKPANDIALHRALCSGLLSRIGQWHPDSKTYIGARQTRFVLHPSSGLAKKPPAWVAVAELVETSQLFGRTAARVDPAWLESIAGPLCKRSYGDPHWEEKPAQVMAKEMVTLYGLPIIRDRKVHFGPIDPKASRPIFILHALVRGEYKPHKHEAPFAEHNRKLLDEVRRIRDKARKSDMLADEHTLALFFDQRVPEGVYSGKTFEAFRKDIEEKHPKWLHLSISDVLADEAEELSPERYPDELRLFGAVLPLSYRFEPGEDDDGITVTIPIGLLAGADPGIFEWTIPAWQLDKIRLLLETLPKAVRKSLGVPVKELAAEILSILKPFEEPLLPALSAALYVATGVRVSPDSFFPDELPPHYRFSYRVTDERDQTLAQDKSLPDLMLRFGARARELFQKAPKAGIERDGITSFCVDTLPNTIPMMVGGKSLFGYPALVDKGSNVSIQIFASAHAAAEAHKGGLMRLFLLETGTSLQKLEQSLPASLASSHLSQATSEGGRGLRTQIALRALAEALALDNSKALPRTRTAFKEHLMAGQRKLLEILAQYGKIAQEIAAEYARAETLLKSLAGKPGAPKATLDEMKAHLGFLISPGLFSTAKLARLVHVPRYLKAVQVRLERLPNGPQKDAQKAEQIRDFWQNYWKSKEGLLKRGVPAEDVDAFRWLMEEFRVSLFAPELKTALSVSAAKLNEQWKLLCGA